MFYNLADELFERAEECRREARRCCNARDRAEWLSLAEEWGQLADRHDSELSDAESLHGPTKLVLSSA